MSSDFSSKNIHTSNESHMSWFEYTKLYYLHDFNIEPCIFEVLKRLSDTKPDAYAPQKVGLGPYHHCRPRLQQMANKKRDDVKHYLQDHKIDIRDIIEAAEKCPPAFEAMIRKCYGKNIDLDRKSLALIMFVDAIFLLKYIDSYGRGKLKAGDFDHDGSSSSSPDELLVPDLMMLENQIPLSLVFKMKEFLPELNFFHEEVLDVFAAAHVFCSPICPFSTKNELVTLLVFDPDRHLLHFMYGLCLGIDLPPNPVKGGKNSAEDNDNHDGKGRLQQLVVDTRYAMRQVKQITGFAADQIVSILGTVKSGSVQMPEKAEKMFTAAQNFKKILSPDSEIDQQRNLFPSISELSEDVGITFVRSTERGILGYDFDSDRRVLYLPEMRLKKSSEVILRNLLAYEASLSEMPKVVANFVFLLSGMIRDEKDVKILRNANIITGELPDNEVVCLFDSLKKSITASRVLDQDKKSNSLLDDFRNQLGQQFSNNPVVKACSRTKNCVVSFFNFLKPLVPMFVVLLLLIESFCDIYDCRRSSLSVSSEAYYPFTDSSVLSLNSTSDQAKFMSARKMLRYSS